MVYWREKLVGVWHERPLAIPAERTTRRLTNKQKDKSRKGGKMIIKVKSRCLAEAPRARASGARARPLETATVKSLGNVATPSAADAATSGAETRPPARRATTYRAHPRCRLVCPVALLHRGERNKRSNGFLSFIAIYRALTRRPGGEQMRAMSEGWPSSGILFEGFV